jgi:hypothetical protein
MARIFSIFSAKWLEISQIPCLGVPSIHTQNTPSPMPLSAPSVDRLSAGTELLPIVEPGGEVLIVTPFVICKQPLTMGLSNCRPLQFKPPFVCSFVRLQPDLYKGYYINNHHSYSTVGVAKRVIVAGSIHRRGKAVALHRSGPSCSDRARPQRAAESCITATCASLVPPIKCFGLSLPTLLYLSWRDCCFGSLGDRSYYLCMIILVESF